MARATITRTRMAIGSQIREALETLGLPVEIADGTTYVINGRPHTAGEAADYLLVGGFKDAYGRNEVLIQPDRLAERDARQAAPPAPAYPAPAPITDASGFRAALTVGSVWWVTSHPARETDGRRVITRNHGRAFDWQRTDDNGRYVDRQTYHPGEPTTYRAEGDSLTYLAESGRPLVTWTRFVRADAVSVGAYGQFQGIDQYGHLTSLTGYVCGSGSYVVRRKSPSLGLIGKKLTGVYVSENPGGWNGWRGVVYSEPHETTAVVLPAPASGPERFVDWAAAARAHGVTG